MCLHLELTGFALSGKSQSQITSYYPWQSVFWFIWFLIETWQIDGCFAGWVDRNCPPCINWPQQDFFCLWFMGWNVQQFFADFTYCCVTKKETWILQSVKYKLYTHHRTVQFSSGVQRLKYVWKENYCSDPRQLKMVIFVPGVVLGWRLHQCKKINKYV